MYVCMYVCMYVRIRLSSETIDVTEKVSKKEDRRFRFDCDDTVNSL